MDDGTSETCDFLRERGWRSQRVGDKDLWFFGEDPEGLPFEQALICAQRDGSDRDRQLRMGTANVRCNRCGASCRVVSRTGDFHGYYGLIDASFTTGFFSESLPDGKRYTFSLCEACLSAMFRDFAIPPAERDSVW